MCPNRNLCTYVYMQRFKGLAFWNYILHTDLREYHVHCIDFWQQSICRIIQWSGTFGVPAKNIQDCPNRTQKPVTISLPTALQLQYPDAPCMEPLKLHKVSNTPKIYMSHCKNSGNRKDVVQGTDIGFQELSKHAVSDGTFPNSDTPFEDCVIPLHKHNFP